VFLIAGTPPEALRGHSKIKGVTVGYRPDGELFLFRANSGKQFKQFKDLSRLRKRF
jgi:hypothetical protein